MNPDPSQPHKLLPLKPAREYGSTREDRAIRALNAVYALTFIFLSLLLEGCAHSNAKLREKLIGTWSRANSELIFASDGRFQSRTTTVSTNEPQEGTWDLRNGVLVMTDPHPSFRVPGTTNAFHPLRSVQFCHKVILIDGTHLGIISDTSQNPQDRARTNVWDRK
jgi:hypothetical protein